jgi:hypothetical protein
MTVIRQLLPIALPHGVNPTNGKGRVAVYFSPRVLTTTTLGALPDWVNWATAANRLTIDIAINGTVVVPRPTRLLTAVPAMWAAIFPTTLPVTGFTYDDSSGLTGRSFPEADIAEAILALYTDVAVTDPVSPPTAAALLARPLSAPLLQADGEPAPLLAAASRFADRINPLPATAPPAPDFDLHTAISILGRHPRLLQLLGIVVELEVPLPPTPQRVSATTNWRTLYRPTAPSTIVEVPSEVRCDGDFYILDDRGEQQGGHLPLASPHYDLVPLDTMTAVRRLAELVRSLDDPAAVGALPALSDWGISLVEHDRLNRKRARFTRQAAKNAQIPAAVASVDNRLTLYADDVITGYRVDVRADGGTFRSLFQRRADTTYRFPRQPALNTTTPDDEGWVGTTLGSERSDGAGSQERRVREVLLRWQGWSAAAPPPGVAADTATGELSPKQPSSITSSTQPVQFEVDYTAVPASLPSLRFGTKYEMKARCVDVAGNSHALVDVPPAVAISESVTYGRLSPIPAPTVLRRTAKPSPGVGDSVLTVVIKSELGQSDSTVVPQERLVFPPRAPQQLCERHGLPTGGTSAAAYADLALRDGTTLESLVDVDPITGELTAAVVGTTGTSPGPLSIDIGYLVDPACDGFAFAGLPGFVGSTGALVVANRGAWPALKTRRLIVRAGTGAPKPLTTGDAPLVVQVPKAACPVVEVSCSTADALLRLLALWQRIGTLGLPPAQEAALRETIKNGRHWMISSRVRVQLVHAVRLPLSRPGFRALVAGRPAVGAPGASLGGWVRVNRASTERVVVRGRWADTVDDPSTPAPTLVAAHQVLGQQKVETVGPLTYEAPLDLTFTLPDTIRHDMEIVGVGFSRFSRYFTEEQTLTLAARRVLNANGVVAASVTVESVAGVPYAAGSDYIVDGVAGTIRRASGSTITTTTTVVVRFVPLPVSRISTEGGAASPRVVVPNALVPPAVDVREVIPATSVTVSGVDGRTITRNGQVLRVWLGRPWMVTGPEERLGVVLDTAANGGRIPTTRVGRDAVAPDGAVANLRDTLFPNRSSATTVDGVRVVAHPVQFDAGRGLWFAEIVISQTLPYRPWVQLAVGRFQPVAIAGAQLSEVTLLDPIRLLPRRVLTVVAAGGGRYDLTVTGALHNGIVGETAGTILRNEMTVTLQEADASIPDPELRWAATATSVNLPAVATGYQGSITVPASTNPKRLLIVEDEPGIVQVGRTTVTVRRSPIYVETKDIPT